MTHKLPSASLLLILGLSLLAITLVLATELPTLVWFAAGAAMVLLLLGLLQARQNERTLRHFSVTLKGMIATFETAGAIDPRERISSPPPQELSGLATRFQERSLDAACTALFSYLEQTLQNLRHLTAEWEKIFDSVEDGIVILDQERRITRINRPAARMLQLDRETALGRFCCGEIHRDGCSPESCPALLMQGKEAGVRGELSTRGDDMLEVFTSSLTDQRGDFFGSVHLLRDIGKELRFAMTARESLRIDPLTGLPNREKFRSELQGRLKRAALEGERIALLLIDLDGFSEINDGLGHLVGDQLLNAAADRLRQTLAPETCLGRLGGDEFAAFIPDLATDDSVPDLVQALMAAFSAPFQLHETQPFYCTASIGISRFPADGSDASQLLKHADIAMYHAKQHGRNTYRSFVHNMDTDALERLRLGTNLRHALERDEFELHYQPRVDLTTNSITGMEALLRWTNLELGSVPPGRFIPLAEENGLILPIGQWVLRAACGQMVAWCSQGMNPPRVAVNLSALQLKSDDLVATVTTILQETGLDPNLLELELTESVLMDAPEASVAKLTALRQLGIRIALDDFGTGYSSLNYLKVFPLDHIKIDRSFIADICQNPDDASIVEVIISIAHTLGLKVIAEGVESGDQLSFLIEHQCDEIQGYYFSRPLPAPAFLAFLNQHGEALRSGVWPPEYPTI